VIGRAAFLVGLLVMPALLVWLGHGLRGRSRRARGAFWGGVIGHSAALVAALIALHYPPVMWTGDMRAMVAMWAMLAGGAAGAALGALRR
jgi:hypothetical protein